MKLINPKESLRLLLCQAKEHLWVQPLLMGLLSVAATLAATQVDQSILHNHAPEIPASVINTLLTVMASSMLVIATFAVSSMVAAYASASNTASPRAFALVIADDVSQRALSVFVGAFIFSIVGIAAFQSELYDKGARFTFFVFILLVFALVILTFVRWVDRIARLGRMGNTIAKVEKAAADALNERRHSPTLGGQPVLNAISTPRQLIYLDDVGYLQRLDIATLQHIAQEIDGKIQVLKLPGSFITPDQPIAGIHADHDTDQTCMLTIQKAFMIGQERRFEQDPRYSIIVLAQIASRALSPAINDAGTAIDIIGILTRLINAWSKPIENDDSDDNSAETVRFDRILVPEIPVDELFNDAFLAIARDGSHLLEVTTRLQKALMYLGKAHGGKLQGPAEKHAARALQLAKNALQLDTDIALLNDTISQ